MGGLRCPACAGRAAQALRDLPGVTSAFVHFETRTATLEWVGPLPMEEPVRAMEGLGYRVHSATRSRPAAEAAGLAGAEAEDACLGRRLAGAGLLSLPVFFASTLALSPFLTFAWTAALLFWGGASFHRDFVRCLHHRSHDPNALLALAACSAGIAEAVRLARPGLLPPAGIGAAGIALLTVLMLLGRWMEARLAAARRVANLRQALAAPRRARLLSGQWRPTEEIKAGDCLAVRAGEAFPVDAWILAGQGEIDGELYGEGTRRAVYGRSVRCGERLKNGRIEAMAEASESDSRFMRSMEDLRQIQALQLPAPGLVERAGRAWMVAIVAAAALAAGYRLAQGNGGAWAVGAFLSTLSLACPPALLVAGSAVFWAVSLGLVRVEPSRARSAVRRCLLGVLVSQALLVPFAAGILSVKLSPGGFALAAAASLAWVFAQAWFLWRQS